MPKSEHLAVVKYVASWFKYLVARCGL